MKYLSLVLIVLLSLSRAALGQADIEAVVTTGSASFTPVYTPNTPGATSYSVSFTVTSSSAGAVITVRPKNSMSATTVELSYLRVVPSSTANPLVVNVGPSANGLKRFGRVKEVNLLNGLSHVSNSPKCSLGSLTCDNVGPTTSPRTLIRASSIGTITAASSITFSTIETRDYTTGTDTFFYDIGTVAATSGNIANTTVNAAAYANPDPVPSNGNIGAITATAAGASFGNIVSCSFGTPFNLGSVRARHGLGANISVGGNVTLISCLNGNITGNLNCGDLGTTATDPNAGLRSPSGMINFTTVTIANLKSSITFLGSSYDTSYFQITNDMTADIRATSGAIGSVLAGRIVAPPGGLAPVIEGTSIGGVGALVPIGSVASFGEINATIQANTGPGAGLGKGVINNLISNGPFNGTVTALRIPTVQIGELGATGTMNVEKLDSGAIGSTSPWRIEDNLLGTINVTGSPAGLTGFVTVNYNASGGVWSGTASVSPVGSLTPVPAYTAVAASLGGGAIGQVPFQLHAEDSTPVNVGSTIGRFGFSTSTSYPGTIMPEVEEWPIWQYAGAQDIIDAFYVPGRRIVFSRFYGPLARATSGGQTMEQGVRIQRWNTSTTCWDEHTDQFVVSDVYYFGTISREIKIEVMECRESGAPRIEPGLYRIVRTSDPNTSSCSNTSRSTLLYSSIPGSSTVEVAQFAHYFKLGVQCNPADMGIAGGLPGSDGILDNNDFIAHINYFFASDPHADVGQAGGLYGPDGLYNNDDFIAFINLFFTGCEHPAVCAPPPGFAGRGEGEDYLQRQIDALQQVYDVTGDVRVLQLLLDARFAAGQ